MLVYFVTQRFNKHNHLSKYENVVIKKQDINWETALKAEAKKVSITQIVKEDTVKNNQPIKQKAFFG